VAALLHRNDAWPVRIAGNLDKGAMLSTSGASFARRRRKLPRALCLYREHEAFQVGCCLVAVGTTITGRTHYRGAVFACGGGVSIRLNRFSIC